jgi:hypothetical protein
VTRERGQSRLPLVYWRSVAPDDSDLLRRVDGLGGMDAARSKLSLGKIAGPQLERVAARESRPDVVARLSPDASTVANLQTIPGAPFILNELGDARASDDWAQLQPAYQIVVREDDFKIPRLRVKNMEQAPVLLPAGSAFLGGAQNRMLLEPTVIPGGSERTIRVFCIEAGRWDETQSHFRSIGRVPSLFLLRLLEAGAGRYPEHSTVHAQHQDLQLYTWQTVLAGLTLAGEINPTMDLMAFARRVPRDTPLMNGKDNSSDAGVAGVWGLFHAHRESGVSGCVLYPNENFSADAIFALKSDLIWRANLLSKGRGAREYFRVFDESKRLAIRCLPDGSPLRDLRKKPVLFAYTDADLTNSFRPPLQARPPAEPLSFAREPAIETWAEMAGYLDECTVELRRIVGPGGTGRGRPGGIAPPEMHSLRFAHPARSLLGSGLLIGGRPAYLEATAFRPHAN